MTSTYLTAMAAAQHQADLRAAARQARRTRRWTRDSLFAAGKPLLWRRP